MSGKPVYIYSTLSSSVNYTGWKAAAADVPTKEWSILIHGGSGVADKRIETPLGVVTEVTEEDLTLLESQEVFQLHKANGFIKVDSKNHAVELVVSEMEGRDSSAPLTPNDYTEKDRPSTGEITGEDPVGKKVISQPVRPPAKPPIKSTAKRK